MDGSSIEALFLSYRETGNHDALTEVVDRTVPRLLQVAVRAAPRLTDADDLVQETFLSAMRAARSFDAKRELMPWLTTILLNHARKMHRKTGQALAEESLKLNESPEPYGACRLSELRAEVRQAISELPPHYRKVLQLHYRGWTATKIGAELQRPPATVRTQLARGLRMLRGMLPKNLLVGATALLATRDASSQARTLAALPRQRPRPAPVKLLAALAALIVVLAGLAFWNRATEATAAPAAATAAAAEAAGTAGEAPSSTEPPVRQPVSAGTETATVLARLHWKDTGEPLARASVRLAPTWRRGGDVLRNSLTRWREGWTDAEGTVTFEAVPAGPAKLYFDDGDQSSELFDVAPGGVLAVEHPVIGYSTVRGTVVGPKGEPIAKASVWLSATGAEGTPGYVVAHTAEDGSFEVRSTSQVIIMWARAAGYAVTDMWLPRHETEVTPAAFTLREPPRRVDGCVLGPDHRPVSGALVGLHSRPYGGFIPPGLYTRTDSEGRYAFIDAQAGEYILSARGPGGGGGFRTLSVKEPTTHTPDLTLSGVVEVRGAALLSDPDSWKDYVLFAYPRLPSDCEPVISLLKTGTYLEPDGSFHLRQVPSLDLWGRIKSSVTPTAFVNEPLPTWQGKAIHWYPRLGTRGHIEGRVRGGSSQPVDGLRVSVVPEGLDWTQVQRYERSATTDADGHFAIPGVGPGPHRLFVEEQRPDGGPGPLPILWRNGVVTGTPIELRIEAGDGPSGSVRGRFGGSVGRRAVGIVVMLRRVGLSKVATRRVLDDPREFRFESVPPGQYHLSVRVAWAPRLLDTSVLDVGVVEVGPQQDLDLGLILVSDPSRLELELRHAGGEDIEHERLAVVSENGIQLSGFESKAGRRGTARLRSGLLAGGRVVARLFGMNHAPVIQSFSIPPGGVTRKTITLPPAARCSFFLRPQDGTRLPDQEGLRLTLFDARGEIILLRSLFTGESKAIWTGGLGAGRYSALARTVTGREGELRFEVPVSAGDLRFEIPLR